MNPLRSVARRFCGHLTDADTTALEQRLLKVGKKVRRDAHIVATARLEKTSRAQRGVVKR